jgi:hypothetical protein
MSSTDHPRQLALAAADQAANGLTEMTRFAREGEWFSGTFHPDAEPVERLLDAAKLAIELRVAVEGDEILKDELGQVYGAICNFLEGWA